ncbi:hypothetical protein [Pedobacter cryophilus]|uniref:Uncharacterized protein n=1 Tax=Pedobacter cryophilus TaxID=2571271 RepID=A0A4U1BTC4_9SPHI|nr:hypothetical protein [Pedobacter cryophilus]TKB95739.1 hypothetical protein FA046_15725 [Pedobacter cryophilus]
MNNILFNRRQLYELVWSESLLSISKRYNISDVGLRKACIRMDIPLPDSGYWSKVRAGKQVEVKPFLDNEKDEDSLSLSIRGEGGNIIESELSEQMTIQKSLEQDLSLDLSVPSILIDPDPLILSLEKSLEKKKDFHKLGELSFPGLNVLDVRVTPENLNRTLCILNTFIKIMRKRGVGFKVSERESFIQLGGENVKMTFRESQTKEIVKEYNWERTNLRPNGNLILKFEHFGASVSCKDGKIPIELQVSKLVAKLELFGRKLEIERIKNEEWHRKYDEERKLAQEFEHRKKLELSSFRKVLNDSRRWNEVVLLRDYITQVEKNAVANNVLTEDLMAWIEWARKKANWFDPILEGSDEWLLDVDPNSLLIENVKTENNFLRYDQDLTNHDKSNWALISFYNKNK